MKKIIYIGTITLGLIAITSCNSTSDQSKSTADTTPITIANVTVDTSGYFIKDILNCSPKEVAKILGKPDTKIVASSINYCDLPSCNHITYQNGKYDVLYSNNKLKWIVINQNGLFNKNAVSYFGFKGCEPTLANDIGIWWRGPAASNTATGPLIQVKGIREICAFPDYVVIDVETNYDKKF